MPSPKEYIEDIKNRQMKSDREFVLDSLTGAIDRLQKAFPRYGSFLMEFVQNADDAKSPSLKIELLQNTVRISNDGLPFSEEDVKSICKVGRSSKTLERYIGYLGVGFKAVFLISESPEIYSGGYQFKFDRNTWQDPEHIPWQIVPNWIDKPNADLSRHKTIFILPLKAPDLMEKIREEVKPEHLNNRILLFLRNIKEVEIIDVSQNFKRRIVKSKFSKTSDSEIFQIQEYENDKLKCQDLWVIFRSTCKVPLHVKKDYVTKEWERENVEKRETLAAFRLDDKYNLVREEKGTAHVGVFSFLPLKEIPSGLNFLIQADFLTAPGRGELARECLWNDWLADEIYNLIVDQCIPSFLYHDEWKMNFSDILYSSEGGHELFDKHIKTPLNKHLESKAVLIDKDGKPSKAEELILVTEEIRELLTDRDLKLVYPDKKILHEKCKPHPDLKVKKAPKDVYDFVTSSESEELIKWKAKKKKIDWFKNLYSKFVQKYDYGYFYSRCFRYNVEHDDFWNRMRRLHRPIILTNYYGVAKIDECYIKPRKIRIPRELKKKFKIVHPQLVEDEKFKKLRKKLNEERYHYRAPETKVIRSLTEADIKDALKRQETLEMDKEKWKTLSDAERIERIKEIRKLWSDYSLSLEDYDFLTLRAKNEKWIKPENLVFPEEYNPEHNIERLVDKGLFDFPLKFVSPVFIKNSSDDEIRKWYRFFEELGVDKIVESQKSKIVQRIGVLTALQFEKRSKRFPRELGESEKRGYDVESKSKREARFIEVKGTSDSSYDIFLTVNEFRALRDKKDEYFVYVVTNALRDPLLSTTLGTKLLEITDTKIIIPFNKWSTEARDEEFSP